MKDKEMFIAGFYCKSCGSMTAIKLRNLKQIRCMGCDARYEFDKYGVWQPVGRSK